MSDLIVVAIPSQDDYVWKISSEKIPHLTLMFLGKQDTGQKRQRMIEFIEHATNSSLNRFGLMIDRRGTLGDKDADVLFFDDYNIKMLENFRSSLLANREISDAYLSATQYPVWTPHLTLGYPTTPANEDLKGLNWVDFDRIALWDGNYEGPSMQLKANNTSLEVSMSKTLDDIFTHSGVKGMKWGVRKDGGSSGSTSNDSRQASAALKKATTHGTNSLSNEELRNVLNRMSLEQQYSKLMPKSSTLDKIEQGQKHARTVLGVGSTINGVIAFVNSPAGKLIRKVFTGI